MFQLNQCIINPVIIVIFYSFMYKVFGMSRLLRAKLEQVICCCAAGTGAKGQNAKMIE